MILLKTCAFTHLPRTGGTFVRTMLEPEVVGFSDHGFHKSLALDLKLRGVPVYGFMRDPVTWYESWYSLCVNGSEVFPAATQDPTILAIGTDKTVDEIVTALCKPTKALKKAAFKMAVLSHGGRLSVEMVELIRRWQDNDVSFYENMCTAFFSQGTRVGKFENLPKELINMLDEAGELTPEMAHRIENTSRINHASRDSTCTLDPATVNIIQTADYTLRTKYGYTE